jgi:extracellular elastinolytic metalloproteinase
MGYDIVGRQVHADGEIWSGTNFDIRRTLIEKYGSGSRERQRECADGKRPPEECPGNRRWIQLYYDAMVLMPVRPSMLDARNAMLAADVTRFGGANQREL